MPQNGPAPAAAADTDAPVRVTQAPAPEPPKGKYIKYVGVATHRLIRPEEWPVSLKSGDRPETALLWEPGNGHMVSAEKISEEAMKVIKDQGDFIVLESNK